jgi:hypothetical protein
MKDPVPEELEEGEEDFEEEKQIVSDDESD